MLTQSIQLQNVTEQVTLSLRNIFATYFVNRVTIPSFLKKGASISRIRISKESTMFGRPNPALHKKSYFVSSLVSSKLIALNVKCWTGFLAKYTESITTIIIDGSNHDEEL